MSGVVVNIATASPSASREVRRDLPVSMSLRNGSRRTACITNSSRKIGSRRGPPTNAGAPGIPKSSPCCKTTESSPNALGILAIELSAFFPNNPLKIPSFSPSLSSASLSFVRIIAIFFVLAGNDVDACLAARQTARNTSVLTPSPLSSLISSAVQIRASAGCAIMLHHFPTAATTSAPPSSSTMLFTLDPASSTLPPATSIELNTSDDNAMPSLFVSSLCRTNHLTSLPRFATLTAAASPMPPAGEITTTFNAST
mmetsp:Transcript_5023/g.6808  ORF Transcript_5023/g.6808 Transcript_5023/m.6808 type:complete len:256 (+) Transcript_5023:779-1546(+)